MKQPARTYEDIGKNLNFEKYRAQLKLKQLEAKEVFSRKFPDAYEYLKNKGLDLGKLREHSTKILSAGALTGSLIFSPPSSVKGLPPTSEIIDKIKGGRVSLESLQKLFLNGIAGILPQKPRPLSPEEEKKLEQIFNRYFGIKTRANLEGEHLNTTYGYIGAEQHLRRYPGDVLENHGDKEILKEGIAPGLGAWGYFAPSKQALNSNLEEIEKWYAVVQTLYLPDWNSRQPYLRNWYKYRKVVIVNVDNGNAIVAAIADSGPAAWTGKHFGGSPEVMEYLGGPRYKKGPVVVFFVDDPENRIPLGPIKYNILDLPESVIGVS